MRSILTRPPIPLALFYVRPMLGKASQGRFMALFRCHLRTHELLWSFASRHHDRRALFCKGPLHGCHKLEVRVSERPTKLHNGSCRVGNSPQRFWPWPSYLVHSGGAAGETEAKMN